MFTKREKQIFQRIANGFNSWAIAKILISIYTVKMNLDRLFCYHKLTVILAFITLYSCSSKKSNRTNLDSAAVIETGVNHVFKKAHFAPEFYTSPLQIIKSKNIPARLNFFLNGKRCELIDAKSREAYLGDLWHPIPYMAVNKLNRDKNNVVNLDLTFPSIGTTFHLKMREKEGHPLSITDMSDSQE